LLKIDREALLALPKDKREEAEQVIAEVERKRKRDPLAFYEPHEKQRIFHSFTAPTKFFSGGNQSGKTTGGLADDIIQAVDRDSLPERLVQYKKFEPPFLCRIMAESFPVLETTMLEKLQDLLPLDQLLGGRWKDAYDKNLRVLYFENGSKFFFQTYAMDVAMMGGATLDRVHFDEEPPLAVYNENAMRVMARSGDLVFTQTPVEGLTWSHEALWQKRGDQVAPGVYKGQDLETVVVDMDDNPALSAADKERRLRGMSEEEKAARKEGRYVALHGLIYADYSTARHLVPARPLPSNVNIVVGIDPGIRNRTAVVWIYLTHDDQMVVFQEGYYQDMTVAQVCKEIDKTNADYDIAPIYYVIDPAARNKNHQTGRSDQMEYADHGIVTIAGQNAVAAGINRIRERFQSDRLFVFEDCVHLDNELQMYRWKQPPKSGEDSRQAPVKKDDHLVDALRYAVMSRPYLPEYVTESSETQLQRAMREDQERFSQPDQTNIGQFSGIAA
jgi:phage terminase large subunit-like protein